jgi:hypothetical protein
MSQYAYIPANRIAELQQSYSIASPASWQFVRDGITYGGFEEVIFSQAQKDEIIYLNGQWFATSQEFQNWMDGTGLLNLVKKRIAVGQKLKLRYLAENAGVTISQEDNIAQLTAFQSVIALLDVGDLKNAYLTINHSIPAASFPLTTAYATKEARKQSYVDELATAVSQLFES